MVFIAGKACAGSLAPACGHVALLIPSPRIEKTRGAEQVSSSLSRGRCQEMTGPEYGVSPPLLLVIAPAASSGLPEDPVSAGAGERQGWPTREASSRKETAGQSGDGPFV